MNARCLALAMVVGLSGTAAVADCGCGMAQPAYVAAMPAYAAYYAPAPYASYYAPAVAYYAPAPYASYAPVAPYATYYAPSAILYTPVINPIAAKWIAH